MLPPHLQPFIIVVAFILGASIGSFLNVVALRFLTDQSIVNPPSHCPQCKAPLKPADNIPVLSFLLLGGGCRSCHAPISIQYPLVELATGLLFAVTVWYFGLSWQTLFLLFLLSNLVVVFITDLRESWIFNANVLPLIPAGLLYNALNLGQVPGSWPLDLGHVVVHVPDILGSALIAIGVAVVFFEGSMLLSKLFIGTEGFGRGDTYLMMGAGAFLGWPLTVAAILLGFVVQAVPAVPMLVYQWIKHKQWGSLTTSGIALIFGLAPLVLVNNSMPPATRGAITLGCMLVAVVALFFFLRQIKQTESFTYLPLGPSLVIGILICLFWGQNLMHAYLTAIAKS